MCSFFFGLKLSKSEQAPHACTLLFVLHVDSMKDNDIAMATWSLQNLLVPSPVGSCLCIRVGVVYSVFFLIWERKHTER